jgi:hypothetical protein
MHLASVVGLVFAFSLSGCAGLRAAPSQSSTLQAGSDVVEQPVSPLPLPSAPSPIFAAQAGVAAVEPASGSATPSTPAPTGATASKTAAPVATAPAEPPVSPAPVAKTLAKTPAPPTPVAKTPAKTPAGPTPAAQPSKLGNVSPETSMPKAPPLDLASLQQRLKETKAVGVLTKITLKNQVDDLLDRFRAFYQGKLKIDLSELRRSYELLVLKVISLLQDSDQALATAIVTSREAIWGILSDPAKFATI